MSDETDPDLPWRDARKNVMLGAVLERFGAKVPTRHRVRDLSATGVRIDNAEGLQQGATVLITIGALESIAATVVWLKDGSAGLRFVSAVNPDAARAKAIVAPSGIDKKPPSAPTVSAGWMDNLKSPHKR